MDNKPMTCPGTNCADQVVISSRGFVNLDGTLHTCGTGNDR